MRSGLSQEEIAHKMVAQKSNISRLDAVNPGRKTLQNILMLADLKFQ